MGGWGPVVAAGVGGRWRSARPQGTAPCRGTARRGRAGRAGAPQRQARRRGRADRNGRRGAEDGRATRASGAPGQAGVDASAAAGVSHELWMSMDREEEDGPPVSRLGATAVGAELGAKIYGAELDAILIGADLGAKINGAEVATSASAPTWRKYLGTNTIGAE